VEFGWSLAHDESFQTLPKRHYTLHFNFFANGLGQRLEEEPCVQFPNPFLCSMSPKPLIYNELSSLSEDMPRSQGEEIEAFLLAKTRNVQFLSEKLIWWQMGGISPRSVFVASHKNARAAASESPPKKKGQGNSLRRPFHYLSVYRFLSSRAEARSCLFRLRPNRRTATG
jgi:hypothetical protein